MYPLNILDSHEPQKWRAVGQSYRVQSDKSELLQLSNYAQLKDMTGSGGVILGPMKYILPVFCRAEHPAPFEHP